MQLKYGTRYTAPVNAASVTARTEPIKSIAGRPLRYLLSLECEVTIDGDDQADLTQKENDVRAALLDPYKSLTLYRDDGQPSALHLPHGSSLSGVTITHGPDFTESQGPEYVILRTAKFGMQAEYFLPNTEGRLVSYEQSISRQGNGGPDWHWRFPLNANKIQQQRTPQSLIRFIHRGRAVGHRRYPNLPPLLFDSRYLKNPEESVTYGFPKPTGTDYIEYPVEWSRIYEPPTARFVLPPLPAF